MDFEPFNRMWKRVEIDKEDSELAHFTALLYMGEMFTKFTVAGMVAGVDNSFDRHQYRLKHRLVRASSLGDWSLVLDDITNGVPRQYLIFGNNEISELGQRAQNDTWQYESVYLLGLYPIK